ncbi:hypothetical protein DPMN_118813 [Dreissena polymorpha]|uniref:Uncharacterized protein n=1 Tax=Dreissena polymorpha TaxID=45954 RepID=A0A9D4JM88_DREPO|nr:hypothetical protein DPMN_118813 [Dreissena polymorpha]
MASQKEDRKHQSLPVVSGNSKLSNLRGRVWNVIDNTTPTLASKVTLFACYVNINDVHKKTSKVIKKLSL